MKWSSQQDDALVAVDRWRRDSAGKQVFRLFGFAGTGKSTLAREVAASVGGLVLFGAFTGKAALVMRSKGCDGARTIHSMIYRIEDKERRQPRWVLNPDSDVADADLIIIDECSMVDTRLGADLLSFGAKVLVLGDPAQLPPVGGAGFFTRATPDVMLTEIHRQAADNPIIRMSVDIRQGRELSVGEYGDSRVIHRSDLSSTDVMDADQVLVGLNRTRHTYNRRLRELKGIASPSPVRGDRLVCLKNKSPKGLLNGGLWCVQQASEAEGLIDMAVTSLDEPGREEEVDVTVPREFFDGTEEKLDWRQRKWFEEFTFGYALTVHKSQGSQWPNVLVFDESAAFREDRTKHLYTAVTRAAETLTVVQY